MCEPLGTIWYHGSITRTHTQIYFLSVIDEKPRILGSEALGAGLGGEGSYGVIEHALQRIALYEYCEALGPPIHARQPVSRTWFVK